MKIDVTRQPASLIIAQFIMLLGLFWYRYTQSPFPAELAAYDYASAVSGGGVPLGAWINSLAGKFPVAAQAGSVLVLVLNAFIITRTLSRNLVFPVRTYIPAIFYAVVSCGIYFAGASPAAIAASYLMVRASSLFISSFVRSTSFGTTFRAAILTGTAMLFHAPAAIYILLVPAAMGVFRRGARESTVAVFGSLIPVSLCAYIIWATGGEFKGTFTGIWEALMETNKLTFSLAAVEIIRLAVIALVILQMFMAIGTFITMASDLRTRAHKVYTFMLWFLLISVAGLLLPCSSIADLTLIAIPVSFIMPAFFVKYRGKVPALFYTATILSVILLNTLPFFI